MCMLSSCCLIFFLLFTIKFLECFLHSCPLSSLLIPQPLVIKLLPPLVHGGCFIKITRMFYCQIKRTLSISCLISAALDILEDALHTSLTSFVFHDSLSLFSSLSGHYSSVSFIALSDCCSNVPALWDSALSPAFVRLHTFASKLFC